ncbi:MAG: hypothetical protein IPN29_09855 [Saprospiraceae bacterium]|nr:hypothetical protein [Saprospiraceae bacterium]
MSFKDTYWSTEEVERLYKAENPEQAIIQPIIAKQVVELNPAHILDYGCGDAYMAKILPDNINIDLYDRNQQSLEKYFKHLISQTVKDCMMKVIFKMIFTTA